MHAPWTPARTHANNHQHAGTAAGWGTERGPSRHSFPANELPCWYQPVPCATSRSQRPSHPSPSPSVAAAGTSCMPSSVTTKQYALDSSPPPPPLPPRPVTDAAATAAAAPLKVEPPEPSPRLRLKTRAVNSDKAPPLPPPPPPHDLGLFCLRCRRTLKVTARCQACGRYSLCSTASWLLVLLFPRGKKSAAKIKQGRRGAVAITAMQTCVMYL